MDIRILATFLLVGHLVSAIFILLVIIKQTKLFKAPADDGLRWFRWILFVLALAIFFGNFIPIAVDALTIFGNIKRSTNHVNAVGVFYSVSNALVFALSALLIWVMYRLAASTILVIPHNDNGKPGV